MERSRAALAAALLTVALGYALVAGLALGRGASPEEALRIFEIGPDPPPPQREKLRPHRLQSSRREGAASPPNLRSEPTEIVAPEPVLRLPVPTPVIAAPIAGAGGDPSAGSAEIAGPGTGSGGQGDGRGSGGEGDGSGDGGAETPPRWTRGELKDSDYPDGAAEAGVGGTVGVRYLVWTDGRVRDCEITRSSGSAELDATTCRLIEARFRFRPSRDARGRMVPAVIVENHSWMVHREPAEPPPPRPKRRWGW
ncbi:energy transducer TonB [Sphingomonas psychrotolerans]|uniref:Energy transducer TonB n=1 Tax=Sphingomonas psychrotolerans TaxID=1327635 RepID=A0A2K8MK16_9SPHN|nr:energy transducer TonB [Sphingomonas psychrotolerans]ATY33354.1 energy transducer TonB [Sphingomonas psychrotolerans]